MELKVTSNIDYLGLRFSSTGSFHQAHQSQANKATFILHKRLNNYPHLTPKHAVEMLHKMITPILCYASEVWGFHDAPDIERVQLKFCKTVLGVKSSVQNDFVYGELDKNAYEMCKSCKYCQILVENCTWWKITLCHEVLYDCITDGWNTMKNAG